MSKHVSETPATKVLRANGIEFSEHVHDYVERGGTKESSSALGLDEHTVVKTLLMQDEKKNPLVVLMHGDRNVSTKNLARQIGVRHIEPCKPDAAERHSGYQVGGTSPFGLRKAMPLYVESTILTIPTIYMNGGRRGYLVGLASSELVRVLAPVLVEVALAK